jgi:hypothetical protein
LKAATVIILTNLVSMITLSIKSNLTEKVNKKKPKKKVLMIKLVDNVDSVSNNRVNLLHKRRFKKSTQLMN